MLPSDFHCKENDKFQVIPVHPGHAALHSDPDFMNTIITGDKSWVYGYDTETKSFRHFSYNENPTRALNTASLKCCLPSTDAIDRRERIHAYVWRFMQVHFIKIRQVFCKKEIMSDTFLTEDTLKIVYLKRWFQSNMKFDKVLIQKYIFKKTHILQPKNKTKCLLW